MTADEIAAMQADALAGTPGEWTDECDAAHFGSQSIVVGGERGFKYGVNNQMTVHVGGWGGLNQQEANTRRIARVPQMEATVTAQAAEIARLREALTNESQSSASLQRFAHEWREELQDAQLNIENKAVQIANMQSTLIEFSNEIEKSLKPDTPIVELLRIISASVLAVRKAVGVMP